MTPEERVIAVAKRAQRWFDNHTRGNALNGPSDDVWIGRELTAALLALDEAKTQDELVSRR